MAQDLSWKPGDRVVSKRHHHGRPLFGAVDTVAKVHKTGRVTLTQTGAQQFRPDGPQLKATTGGTSYYSSSSVWVRLTPEVEREMAEAEGYAKAAATLDSAAEALTAYARKARQGYICIDPELQRLAEAINARFEARRDNEDAPC